MGMMSEFKEFAMRGSVVDLAVGVVIGAAFGKIVTALVDKVIMPPIGLLIGGVDFSKWVITLKQATVDAAGEAVPAVVIGIGEFLNAVIQFVILAFAIFLVVKAINRFHRKPDAAPAATPEDVLLLREIRDELKGRTSPTP
ncbi:large-conductance mechanosensitive channel protein MscL [Luteimonas notoginsengisoli]|jgi:large conductance mechanosensitive channel|uniref:Large-conductance mechanosensitive channel n=1 Tax=Luteimonas notoginsengisoli TaxID=1578200 RepID=A0ABV7UP39_9GAMM